MSGAFSTNSSITQTEVETGTLPLSPADHVAVNFFCEFFRVFRSGHGDDRVGVGVVDVLVGNKGVQRRVDAAGPRVQVVHRVRVHSDHFVLDRCFDALLVGVVINEFQGVQLVHIKRCKVLAFRGAQIAARTFDEHHLLVSSRQRVGHSEFAAGVAAARVG